MKQSLATLALRIALLVAFLVGCQDVKECGGGTGLDLPGLGVVHECETGDGTRLELCWRDGSSDDLAESLDANGYYGTTCWPTERHLGPCRWSHACEGGGGSNALNGPWCPKDERP